MATLVKEDGNEVITESKVESVVMETHVTAVQTTDEETVDENGKRKAQLPGDNKERKKRLKTTSYLSDSDKNPCMLLNEKCRDVAYDVLSQVGPVHMPIFTVKVTIGDQTFIGNGPSKKRAKLAAAEVAVQKLNLYSLAARIENSDQPTKADFTSDMETVTECATILGQPGTKMETSEPEAVETTSTKDITVSIVHGKHPVLILNELRPRAEYTIVEDERTETGERKCIVTVDGQNFEVFGHSKKMAKAKAAEMALTKLFGLSFSYLKDGQPIYQGDDSLWTKYKIKEPQPFLETIDGKNPIQMLNELFRELNYEFIDVSNDVTVGTKFCVVVEIDGQTFRGEGTTKKMAKTNCAMAAVRALTDSGVLASRIAEKEAKKKKMMRPYSGASDSELLDSAVIKLAVHFPDLQYRHVSQSDTWSNGMMSYTVAVNVRGESFFATGPTVKAAKNLVADKVLSKLGLWSAEDVRAKQEAPKMEADSTNPSCGRGRGGCRGFRGKTFGNRGLFRGGIQGGANVGAFPDLLPNYGMTSVLGTRGQGGPVEWHRGGSRGRRGSQAGDMGYGCGSASTRLISQDLGPVGSIKSGTGRSRGTLYRGSAVHGCHGDTARGGVSRGNLGLFGKDRGTKRSGYGQGRGSMNQWDQMDNSFSKACDSMGQVVSDYSRSCEQFSDGVLDSAYQTNVVNTLNNKSSAWPSSSYGKNKESSFFAKNSSSWHGQGVEKGSSWPISDKNSSWKGQTPNKSSSCWQNENKPSNWNDQRRKPLLQSKADVIKFVATSWNSDTVHKHDNKTETFATGWYKKENAQDFPAYYTGEYGTSEAASADNYGYKLDVPSQPAEYSGKPESSEYGHPPMGEYFDTTTGATYSAANDTYFQQDSGADTGTAGGTYEYEGTSDTYTGMYASDSTGNAYENYGRYGGGVDLYALGGI